LNGPVLRAKLTKGMSHNYYGEPANLTIFYIFFSVVILGTIAYKIGIAVLEPFMIGEPTDPFTTPLEILPEWYFFLYFKYFVRCPL